MTFSCLQTSGPSWTGTGSGTASTPSPSSTGTRHSSVIFSWLQFRMHLIWIRIRIQHFKLNSDPDPGVFDDKNREKKKIQLQKTFFLSKTTIYLSLSLHKGRPSYNRCLQLSKENIQHFKTYFCGSFFPSWIRIQFRSWSATVHLLNLSSNRESKY